MSSSALLEPRRESDFQAQVIELARYCGWRHYHPFDSRRSIEGFPDLVLVHPLRRHTLFVELKLRNGRLSPAQERWLEDLGAAGNDARVWRPADWDEIESLLTGEAGHGPAQLPGDPRRPEGATASTVPASGRGGAPLGASATGPCPASPAGVPDGGAGRPGPHRGVEQRLARVRHDHEIEGSNPSPATSETRRPLRELRPGDVRRPGAMTASQAGRLGGLTTAAKYGQGYMRRLARKGGAAGGRPKLRTLAEIEAETRGSSRRKGQEGGAMAS